MAEVTAGLVRKVLPTKKKLYRIAEQAGFDANRIIDVLAGYTACQAGLTKC